MRHQTFLAAIDDFAASSPDRTALISGTSVTSFGELSRRSRCVAAGLARLGIGHGDRVAVWLANRSEWVELALACARLGAIVVSTNTRFRTLDLGDVLERSGAKVLVFWPGFQEAPHLDILSGVKPDQLAALSAIVTVDGGSMKCPVSLAGKTVVDYASLLEHPPLQAVQSSPRDAWFLFTTSGTTQKPKFVIHSHASICGHGYDFAAAHLFGSGTVVCVPHPISGVLGFTPTLSALQIGAPVVLITRFDGKDVAEQMLRHRVTNISTIDEGLMLLLHGSEQTPIFPDFRFAMFGALNGKPEDFVRLADSRGLRCVGSYGMTEIHAGFTLQRIDGSPGERAPGGGYPICPQAKIRIVDQKTRRPVAPGEAGELEVLTPHMMSGYFENEAATRDAFTDDGYFRTGDLGFLEADGNFRFLARGGDALRLSGFLVSPAEVSFCVETHPSVRRCEVVGVPRDAGMIAVGFVIMEPGVPFEEDVLVAHCRRNLATYKVPARFVQLDAFPTTEGANGPKVQRAKLREMAGSLTELTAPKQR